jgi:hypothetical protein
MFGCGSRIARRTVDAGPTRYDGGERKTPAAFATGVFRNQPTSDPPTAN